MTDHIADTTPDVSPRSDSREIACLRAQIGRLETLALRLHDEAKEAEVSHALRRAALESWVAETEARLSGVEAENARLRHEIAELHASTSWRLTAPLRWLRLRMP
jgi:hypothetical protein